MHVDAITARRIEKSLKALPDDELTKWRNETGSQYLKSAIDSELTHCYWNNQTTIEPWHGEAQK
jgi:hypothetical protein